MHRSTLWFVLALVVPGVVLAQGELRFADLDSCALQSGQVIEECRLGYRVFGELDADRSNVVLVPTWFTGTTGDLVQLIGPGGFLDSSIYYVVAVDALGNGVSSSPSNSEAQLGAAFPGITIRDMVESQHRLVTEVLGLESVYAVSAGGASGMVLAAVTDLDFPVEEVRVDLAALDAFLRVVLVVFFKVRSA